MRKRKRRRGEEGGRSQAAVFIATPRRHVKRQAVQPSKVGVAKPGGAGRNTKIIDPSVPKSTPPLRLYCTTANWD